MRIISPIKGANPDINSFLFWNSLQNSDILIRVIVVAANDLSGVGNVAKLANLYKALSLNILMLRPGDVKKSAGNNQQDLFRWLTNVSESSHFDLNVKSAGQVFIKHGRHFIQRSGKWRTSRDTN